MDRLFRIDFYPQDWLIDTARLPLEERGIYIQIIMLIYANRGPIENDAAWIAGVSGCSSRLARSLIEKLIVKEFLRLNSGGKITQKRAENELKTKRNHLETSAKGGRNSREKASENKKISDLAASNDTFPVGTSTPTPTPTPTPEDINSNSPVTAANGDRSSKNSGKGSGVPKFDIAHHLDAEDAWMDARAIAAGWDIHHLARVYSENINSGSHEKPHSPVKAFLGWLPKYTKGAPPK